MADGTGSTPVELWQSAPPSWLDRTHTSSDLGYPGFHPPRPGQEEDLLSDKHIRDGFSSASNVAAETYSALGLAKEAIADFSLLGQVENLTTRVLARRSECQIEVPRWSFKLPGRAVFNDKRRLNWIKDLADPQIPLQNLGRSVPSGIKGYDLLDMLSNNNISMPRALWYIRVLGGNDTQGIRTRSSQDDSQYSIEWTCTLTGYLRKLLSDIALPSPPRQGLNIRQSFKNSFVDAETSEQWTIRCAYILDLINTCYSEKLVDRHTYLSWLASQADPNMTNPAQFIFLARLAEEYIEGLASSRTYSRPFIRDYLDRVEEFSDNPHTQIPLSLCSMRQLLLKLMLINPETLICAEIWRSHSSLIENIISECECYKTCQSVGGIFRDIKLRNEALLLHCAIPESSLPTSSSLSDDFQILSSISRDIPPSQSTHFADDVPFPRKLGILLVWSVSNDMPGHHRIYAATTLLSEWLNMAVKGTKPSDTSVGLTLHDLLFDWLDSLDRHPFHLNRLEVPRLFGELIRRQLFSYDRYIQRLVSRGDRLSYGEMMKEEPGVTHSPLSPHAQYVRDIPLIRPDPALERQRKSVLYGHRSRCSEEDTAESDIRKEVINALPYFFSDSFTASVVNCKDQLYVLCPRLLDCSPYVQVRVWRGLVAPAVHGRIHAPFGDPGQGLSDFRNLFELMNMTRSYVVLFEVIIKVLLGVNESQLVNLSLELVIRFSDILVCMNGEKTLCSAISSAAPRWRANGVDLRTLLVLIDHLHLSRHLSRETYDVLDDALTSSIQLHHLSNNAPTPPNLVDDIVRWAYGSDTRPGSVLASEIWEAYKRSPELTWVIWDSVIESLKKAPKPYLETPLRDQCIARYADFLACIATRTTINLDSEVQSWLEERGPEEWAMLDSATFELFVSFLRKLLSQDIIRCQTVLTGFICTVWKDAMGDAMVDVARKVKSCIALAYPVLLCVEAAPPAIPLAEFQHLTSQRANTLRGASLRCLVDAIPSLVRLELSKEVDEVTRNAIIGFRKQLTESVAFKQSLLRDVSDFRGTFLSALERDAPDSLTSSQIARAGNYALQLLSDDATIFSPLNKGGLYDHFQCLYSFKIQLTLLQLAEDPDDLASEEIDAFVSSFFSSTPGETGNLLGEITPGAKGTLRLKFIIHGLWKLTASMEGKSFRKCNTQEAHMIIESMARTLKVMGQFTEPWSSSELVGPGELDELQGELVTLIKSELPWLLATALNAHQGSIDHLLSLGAARRGVTIFTRLTHFLLAFLPRDPPLETQNNLTDLRDSLITKMISSSNDFDAQLFTMVFDTASYLTDVIQKAEKHNHHAEGLQLNNICNTMRPEDYQRLRFLIASSHVKPAFPETALVPWESPETEAFHAPLRPWESLDRGELQSDPQDPSSKNVGSIALDQFSPRISSLRMVSGDEDENCLLFMLEGTSLDSPFERDWSETRLNSFRRPTAIIPGTENVDDDSSRYTVPTPVLRPSPTPSAQSIFSGSGRTSGSWKASPTTLSSKSVDLSNPSQPGSQNKRKKSPCEEVTNKRSRVTKSNRSNRK